MSPLVAGLVQVGVLIAALAVAYRPLGDYMARVFTARSHSKLERAIYRFARIDPDAEQKWSTYAYGVLGFSFAVSAIAGVLIGLAPALQQSKASPGTLMGEGARGASAGMGRRRLRTALVVAQVAMALVVLNTAGLLGRSFIALERVEPGFEPDGVMSAYVNLPRRAGGPYDSGSVVPAVALNSCPCPYPCRSPGRTARRFRSG